MTAATEAPSSAASYPGLRGRGVIVTGGASGIGADIVRAFAAQGCAVGFVDRDEAAGDALASSLPRTFFEVCDVTDVAALQAAIASLLQRTGGCDVLVNNVANDQRETIDALTPEFFERSVAVNLRPHYFATQAVLASMRERGGGAIVNLGSASWRSKTLHLSLYAACKAAILGFTRCLAREVGSDAIRVNCVVPGWVMTARQLATWVDEAGERAMDENQCLPGRIFGSDIADAVLFLASDAARMISAQELVVDAGWS